VRAELAGYSWPGRSARSAETVLASTNNDLNLSMDEGRTWQPQNVKAQFPWAYCRGVIQKADDPSTLFVGNGNGPPGSAGAVQISRDGGKTWRAASLPVRRTARSGRLRPPPPLRTRSSAPQSAAMSIAAGTAAEPGANWSGSSAKSARWP